MTTPNVRCTCTGTCHPPRSGSLYDRYSRAMGAGVNPVPINGVLRRDTGVVHGPLRLNECDCADHYRLRTRRAVTR